MEEDLQVVSYDYTPFRLWAICVWPRNVLAILSLKAFICTEHNRHAIKLELCLDLAVGGGTHVTSSCVFQDGTPNALQRGVSIGKTTPLIEYG